MKKLLPLVAILVALYIGWSQLNHQGDPVPLTGQNDEIFVNAFEGGKSDIQVEGKGIVIKVLSDDNDGSRHQRFLLRLDSGQTLLIAHNIDLAPRVSSLSEGDGVAFYGVYEWNSKGGVIHWTHHDPNDRHVPGWLQHNGETYQ
jgi:hypothetical protein